MNESTADQGAGHQWTGHQCPECGAPRGADHTSSCDCTRRASDALRETRTTEAAAAEDFDPLRIRPYVELEPPRGEAGTRAGPEAEASTAPAPHQTVPMPLAAPAATSASAESATTGDLQVTLTPPASAPGEGEATPRPVRPLRLRLRRRGTVLTAGGAVVAVLAAAGFTSVLFAYQSPSREGHPPGAVRAAVPDRSTSAASVSPATQSTPTPPASPTPTSPEATGPSASTAPSTSASSGSPRPSRTAEPSGSTTSSAAGRSGAGTDAGEVPGNGNQEAPVLRRGDQGPEVAELQQRLRELRLYDGEIDGSFDSQVEDALRTYQMSRVVNTDNFGVYDHPTRAALESHTSEP